MAETKGGMRKAIGNEKEQLISYMKLAAQEARKGLCLRAKCGTIIARLGKIIGKGYNAPPLDNIQLRTCQDTYNLPENFRWDKTCCIHAEWRAIMDALAKHPDKVNGSILLFTRIKNDGTIEKAGPPKCTVCSRLALDVGIKEFVLWHPRGIVLYDTEEYNKLSYAYTGENTSGTDLKN